MKAGVVTPGEKYSASLVEMTVPLLRHGTVLVKMLEVGIDGTDMEINRGQYGEPPAGYGFLVLGHEALGEVENAGASDFSKGELVVPVVRRPDGCVNCRSGQYDMCLEGNYWECGIRGAHGFMREYLVEETQFLVRVPRNLRQVAVLTEPMSIATKGIDQAIEFHRRSANLVQVALVLGAGSLGLLVSAFLQLQGLSNYTLDIVPKSSLKAQLVEAIGATYLDGRDSIITELPGQIGNLDLIVEATGNSTVAFQAMSALGVNGVLCLMGVSTGEKPLEICADCLNMQMVLGNKTVFGTVSSNRSHFERAIQLLGEIEQRWPRWLGRLITRRLNLGNFKDALHPTPDSIKTVIEIV
jgi:threonine dehydrogenase-like Zn-dependent dehydrogenase